MDTTVAQTQKTNNLLTYRQTAKKMTTKEIIQSFQEALGKGDIPKAFSFFAPDAKWHQPGSNRFSGTKNNPDEIVAMFTGMMADTKGSFVVKPNGALMVNGNLVASPVRFSGTDGSKSINMTGVDLFEVTEGRITQVWLFSDDQQMEDEFWEK